MLDKIIYNTVLCQTFTQCGNYLIAGNIYGQIAVFDLNRLLNPVAELISSDYNKPKYTHQISDGQINSLATTNKFLIIGTVGEIKGYDYNAILNLKLGKPSWTIRIPAESFIDSSDINSLWIDEKNELLYVGCGDNNVYVFNLEDGKLMNTFKGHEDYIHSVNGKDNQLVTASEDGSVKIWDLRIKSCHNSIVPHANSKLARPDLGKWVGAASMSDDWIVCGGGPRLALWHLRSLDVTTVFDIPDHGIHIATFHEDLVIAGGTSKHLYQMDYSGEVKVEIPISSTTAYSAVMRSEPNKVLTVAGSSPCIDFCSSFNYRDQVLHFR